MNQRILNISVWVLIPVNLFKVNSSSQKYVTDLEDIKRDSLRFLEGYVDFDEIINSLEVLLPYKNHGSLAVQNDNFIDILKTSLLSTNRLDKVNTGVIQIYLETILSLSNIVGVEINDGTTFYLKLLFRRVLTNVSLSTFLKKKDYSCLKSDVNYDTHSCGLETDKYSIKDGLYLDDKIAIGAAGTPIHCNDFLDKCDDVLIQEVEFRQSYIIFYALGIKYFGRERIQRSLAEEKLQGDLNFKIDQNKAKEVEQRFLKASNI